MSGPSDSFTAVTSRSWGSRIMSSIKGIFFGFVLIVVVVVLLWWNEGCAVKTAKSLTEGASARGKVSFPHGLWSPMLAA